MASTKTGTICAICERGISALSPEKKNELHNLQYAGVPDDKIDKTEQVVSLDHGKIAHTLCKKRHDFVYGLGTPQNIAQLRMKGYKAGRPFASYMNYGYGSQSPAMNSYRLLLTAYSALFTFRWLWMQGDIIPGQKFKQETIQSGSDQIGSSGHCGINIKIEDLDIKEDSGLWSHNELAQAVLCFAVIIWKAAHEGGLKRNEEDRVEVYLDKNLYCGSEREDWAYFNAKRNISIAHPYKSNWDSLQTSKEYLPYPDWANDWCRFEKVLMHSVRLCNQKIYSESGLGQPEGIGPLGFARNSDTLRIASDFVRA